MCAIVQSWMQTALEALAKGCSALMEAPEHARRVWAELTLRNERSRAANEYTKA